MNKGWVKPPGKAYCEHYFVGTVSLCGRWKITPETKLSEDTDKHACCVCATRRHRPEGQFEDAMEGLLDGDGAIIHQMIREQGGIGLAANLLKAERKIEELQGEVKRLQER